MPAPAVYLASPYGFSAATRAFSDALVERVRAEGLEPLDPWADPDGAIAAEAGRAASLGDYADRAAAFRALNRRLGDANLDRIGRAAAVLAMLDGADVDSGVAAEIGWAACSGLPVVGVRLDLRPAGENIGGLVNLQVERIIERSGGTVCRSLDDGLAALRRLVAARA